MDERKRLLFVYNPNAGKGQVCRNLSYILEKLREQDYELVVYPTVRQGDAMEIVYKEASKYQLLVCSGGDGTLNEAADGLMRLMEQGKPVPVLGYIPAGTVNDFAFSLGIPKNPEEAVEVITSGREFATDFGSIHGAEEELLGHFTYIAGFGAFTEVSYETPQNVKNVIGRAAYFLEGVKRLPDIRPYEMKVTFGDQIIEGKFLFGMVTNSKSVGGFKGLTGKEVCLDDGMFDVILIRQPKNPAEFQDIINSLITRELVGHTEGICHFHTDKVVFESKENIPWVLDGESGGIHCKVTIYNHQRALTIKVPAEE